MFIPLLTISSNMFHDFLDFLATLWMQKQWKFYFIFFVSTFGDKSSTYKFLGYGYPCDKIECQMGRCQIAFTTMNLDNMACGTYKLGIHG